MKAKALAGLALAGALTLAVAGVEPARAEEYYRLTVSREDSNLYEIHEVPGVYVKTRMCLELALMDEAILVWDGPYSFNNKLVFDLDYGYPTTCDVEGLVRKVDTYGY